MRNATTAHRRPTLELATAALLALVLLLAVLATLGRGVVGDAVAGWTWTSSPADAPVAGWTWTTAPDDGGTDAPSGWTWT